MYTVLPIVLPMLKGPIQDATNFALGYIQEGINATVELTKGALESQVEGLVTKAQPKIERAIKAVAGGAGKAVLKKCIDAAKLLGMETLIAAAALATWYHELRWDYGSNSGAARTSISGSFSTSSSSSSRSKGRW